MINRALSIHEDIILKRIVISFIREQFMRKNRVCYILNCFARAVIFLVVSVPECLGVRSW